ncbi:MAG: hypothetical protein DMG11_16370 [Acidobacteria bacterium]|nr:MAG: hypothetical protein DMG11_16370 [Acidobacteriota bacterium]
MNLRKAFLPFLFVSFCFVTASCAQSTPKLTLSTPRIQHHGHVGMQGTGFTPKHNVTSHLRRPDGTEFPVLPILTDDHGAFTHDIDTLLLSPGTHEVWVVDDTSKVSSNVARFEVTLEP